MEPFLVLVGLALLVSVAVSPVLAIVALVRAGRADTESTRLRADLAALEARLSAMMKLARAGAAAPDTAAPHVASVPAASAPVTAPAAQTDVSRATAESVPLTSPPAALHQAGAERGASAAQLPAPIAGQPRVPPSDPPRVAPTASVPPRPPRDLATNLVPKIMVGVAATFVVISLGLFVRYAWENDWVGPAGRILFGAVFSLGMLAYGTRLLDREYRPLGQALAGAGVAGLYVTAFGAHGFYDLIPREAAGLLMIVITACAVLLAMRLDARLLAALAWFGGYLTPVLLSTGQDRALALFLYLTLLDLGALYLDHRKPWPETAPLAMFGTLVLYAGWYTEFFRAERFGVAAFGLVLFTALFALGMARKERTLAVAIVLGLAAIGVAALAEPKSSPAPALMVLSLGLVAAALTLARRMATGSLLALVGAAGFVLPLLFFFANHDPLPFAVAAAWVLAGVLAFAVASDVRDTPVPAPLEAAVLLVGAAYVVHLSAVPKEPLPVLGLLLAFACVTTLARARFAAAELIGIATTAVATLLAARGLLRDGGSAALLLLATPAFGWHLVTLLVRGLGFGRALDPLGVAAHVSNASWFWAVLYRALLEHDKDSTTLALASVALAAVYLGSGFAALRRQERDVLHVRTLLGVAATFLTIAIPVKLGLHAITIAWAAEGVVLLALGRRFASPLTRLGGYLVLALAAARLLVRHTPLHAGPFVPVINSAFGTWLSVIAALFAALFVTRELRQRRGSGEQVAGIAIAALALGLLFAVCTGETTSYFDQLQRAAGAAQDPEAVRHARLMGGLALSVLWSLFASGMLSGGLALRSRVLFYAALALFTVTAAKVLLVDLSTLQTIYRILSSFIIGLLLLGGAFLAIRFRSRLEAPAEA